MKYHEHLDDEIKFIAKELATHSFQKHVVEQQEFGERERHHYDINGRPTRSASGQTSKTTDRDLAVTTEEELKDYIISFLKNPRTKAIAIKDNHQSLALYNKQDNTLAIIDVNGANLGTIYRPQKGIAKFQDLTIQAKNVRNSAPVISGGYIGLRESKPKKHPFVHPDTQQSLLHFLKENGRTVGLKVVDDIPFTSNIHQPISESKESLITSTEEEHLSFIVKNEEPVAVQFNSTNKTISVITPREKTTTTFETEQEATNAFEEMYNEQQEKTPEDVDLIAGTSAELNEIFKEKTGFTVPLLNTNSIADGADDTPFTTEAIPTNELDAAPYGTLSPVILKKNLHLDHDTGQHIYAENDGPEEKKSYKDDNPDIFLEYFHD